jgi:hypothetical protein
MQVYKITIQTLVTKQAINSLKYTHLPLNSILAYLQFGVPMLYAHWYLHAYLSAERSNLLEATKTFKISSMYDTGRNIMLSVDINTEWKTIKKNNG